MGKYEIRAARESHRRGSQVSLADKESHPGAGDRGCALKAE